MNPQEAKNEILARIKAGKPALRPLPDVPMYPYQGDPVEEFISHLLNFDGKAVKFKTRADAIEWLKTQPEMDMSNRVVYSAAQGVEGNMDDDCLSDLHNAAEIDTCVAEGVMGVGEMGSIWVTDESLGHAACALLSRRLFLFLDAGSIVGGLHEAYAGIKLRQHQYGSFYTGPSATADIEAVHITGAQGPLSLTAMIYNVADAPETPQLMVNPNADTSVWQ